MMAGALAGRRIAVPETRELDVLARMLERHGAETLRCPLVAIRDAPDPAPVEAWLRRFVDDPPDHAVLLTGEGVERLLGSARRSGLEDAFLAALSRARARRCAGRSRRPACGRSASSPTWSRPSRRRPA